MEEIGNLLRETRERLGLTLGEIERTTHIRVARLEALERGDLESMPSEAQARGFLRNYADALGLDPEELLARYDESRGQKLSRPRAAELAHIPAPRRPGRSASEFILTTLVALAVIAVLVWGSGQLLEAFNQSDETPTGAAAASIQEETSIPTPAPAATATNSPGGVSVVEPTAVTPTATLILNVLDRVNLRIVVETDSFLEVVVDGKQAFRGRAQAGKELTYSGNAAIEVTTGNAGGLRVFFNDRDEGLMGEIGQVMVRIWTPRGAQTPTPTVTVTPTPSPFITATATSSQGALTPQAP
ncbi:MAG: helix-turn-helix domain-containing protein [Anaerolineales bacterium]